MSTIAAYFSDAEILEEAMDNLMMDIINATFEDGVRAAGDEANLCSRKLRVAIVALEQIAEAPAGAANGESADALARRLAARTALDRIAGLK